VELQKVKSNGPSVVEGCSAQLMRTLHLHAQSLRGLIARFIDELHDLPLAQSLQ
jgi:hypothetical protein